MANTAVVLLLCCFGFWGPISVTRSGMVLVWSNWRNRQMNQIDFEVKTLENVGVPKSQSAITSVEPSQQHEWFRCVTGSNTTRRVVLCYSNFGNCFGPQHSVTNTTRSPRVVLFVLSVLLSSLKISSLLKYFKMNVTEIAWLVKVARFHCQRFITLPRHKKRL